MKKKDLQRKLWMITINNPEEHGVTHEVIHSTLQNEFPTLQYYALCDEQGSCYHIHCVVLFKSRVRFSTIKGKDCFSKAHIEAANGNLTECVSYLKKDGKWLTDEHKQEQKIEGTFEEWGEMPIEKGKNSLFSELYKLVKEGYTNAEIIAENSDFILYLDLIDRLRTTLLIEENKNKLRLGLRCIYIFGPTAVGKSKYIFNEHSGDQLYRVTDYQHPFDHYSPTQSVICFEEFRSSLKIEDMLKYLDIYPIQLPSRYANKIACYDLVYIVTNIPLEAQYPDIKVKDPETYKAFLRRIHEVWIFNKDGSITKYDSVEKYMERDQEFHPITDTTIVPFKQEKLEFEKGDKNEVG